MSGGTNIKIVRNSKIAFGIAFDGNESSGDLAMTMLNVIISGVDNSSSSHADNLTNYLLVLIEGDTIGINGSFDAPGKKV